MHAQSILRIGQYRIFGIEGLNEVGLFYFTRCKEHPTRLDIVLSYFLERHFPNPIATKCPTDNEYGQLDVSTKNKIETTYALEC